MEKMTPHEPEPAQQPLVTKRPEPDPAWYRKFIEEVHRILDELEKGE